MTETRTYWHIAHRSYDGGDLVCRNRLDVDHPATEWKWGDDAPEGFDGDVVCVFPDTPRGRTEADWLWYEHSDGHLLRIDIPADRLDGMTTVEEGYPAVVDGIPAEWITLVRTGYAEGVVTQEGDSY